MNTNLVLCLFYIFRGPQWKLGSYEDRILVHLEGIFNSAQIFALSFFFLEPVTSASGEECVGVRGAGGNALGGVDNPTTTAALAFKIPTGTCELHWVVTKMWKLKI